MNNLFILIGRLLSTFPYLLSEIEDGYQVSRTLPLNKGNYFGSKYIDYKRSDM